MYNSLNILPIDLKFTISQILYIFNYLAFYTVINQVVCFKKTLIHIQFCKFININYFISLFNNNVIKLSMELGFIIFV